MGVGDAATVPSFAELHDRRALVDEQRRLAAATPEPWIPPASALLAAGAFVAFARGEQGPGRAGDRAHVGAAATRGTVEVVRVAVAGRAGARYEPGLLAAREGELLAAALAALFELVSVPDVVLVDATGRDHPRGAGLALHLGAVLGLPSIGITHRPLVAGGPSPPDVAGASTDLLLDGVVVGRWLRTRVGVRPVAVHAAWRTDPATAVEVVMRSVAAARTPEPLRLARTAAREARSATTASR